MWYREAIQHAYPTPLWKIKYCLNHQQKLHEQRLQEKKFRN